MSAGMPLFNTARYSLLEFVVFALAGVCWVVVYAVVIRNIRRHGVVEIPTAAIVSNLAWETLWGLVFRTDLGTVFVWGYRSWLVLDVFIFVFAFRHGAQHVNNPIVRRWFRPAFLVGYVAYLLLIYTFVTSGRDVATGMTSGYIVGMIMSVLYVLVELRNIAPAQYSYVAGWGKFLGNTLGSVFCFLTLRDHTFLLTLCVLSFFIDGLYVVIMIRRRRAGVAAPASPLGRAHTAAPVVS